MQNQKIPIEDIIQNWVTSLGEEKKKRRKLKPVKYNLATKSYAFWNLL